MTNAIAAQELQLTNIPPDLFSMVENKRIFNPLSAESNFRRQNLTSKALYTVCDDCESRNLKYRTKIDITYFTDVMFTFKRLYFAIIMSPLYRGGDILLYLSPLIVRPISFVSVRSHRLSCRRSNTRR